MGSLIDSLFMYAFLGVLYFIQGVPHGVQDKLLPQHLRSAKYSYTRIALARALLLPWIMKPLFASIIEKRWTQKRWLQIFLTLLAAVTWIMSSFGDNVTLLLATFLLVNIMSASFDVSVDSVAMDVLRGSQLGMGNAIQVGAYKVGAIFGGGFLFLVEYFAGLKGVLRGLSVVYVFGLIVVTFRGSEDSEESDPKKFSTDNEAVERTIAANDDTAEGLRRRKKEQQSTQSDLPAKEANQDSAEVVPSSNYDKIKWILSIEGTVGLIVFLTFYKSGEYGILTTYPSFLLDRGYSYFVVGFFNGVAAQVVSVLGSLIGGYMSRDIRNTKLKRLLRNLCIARVLPAAVIFLTNTRLFGRPANVYTGVSSMLVLNLISGMITTVVFTMMMSCSQQVARGYRTTHFSLLCTIEVLGKLLFTILVGPCVDMLGKPPTYFIMTVCTALTVATVRYIK